MIRAIVHKYQAVYIFALMMVILGVSSYNSLPRESSPEIRRPMIFVTTVYSGVSAKDIETLVTKEIEDELDGLEGLDKITSSSSLGVSSITAEFTDDTKTEVALRRIRDAVDTAKSQIPSDAEEPVVKELNFSDQPIFIVNVSHPSGLEILESAASELEEDIKAIPGVLDVLVSGKLERELAIHLDPARLKHYGFSIENVTNAIRNEHVTIPGGVLKNIVRQYSLSVSGEIKTPERFQDIVVAKKGKQVKLRDLGHVEFHFKDPDTINRMDSKPAISLAITKRSGENLLRIVDDVKAYIKEVEPSLPHGTVVGHSYDASDEVKSMVSDLENNILSGLCLVLLITLFFLGPINATFVSLGIPFSMLISFFVLSLLGITLNMVVLFSLVLALGMLVDNGIVIVENIYRHRGSGKNRIEAAIVGTSEVAWPITTSTLTTILAFFPIVFMPGIMGEFMGYIPKTVIIVLTSSLVVGLTITTVFCSRFLRISPKNLQAMTVGATRFQKFQDIYGRMLSWALRHPWIVSFTSFIVVAAGIALNSTIGREPIFFPKLDPKVANVSITTPSGTPLEITDDVTAELEAAVPTVPISLESLQATSGKGGGRTRSNKGNIRIGFLPFLEREIPGKETIEHLKKAFASVSDAEIKVLEQKGGPPSGHDIALQVYGEDYEVMGEISERMLTHVRKHADALEEIDSDFEAIKPEIKIDVDREKAALFGLNTRLIASSVRTAINGSRISKFRMGKEEYDVVVKFQEDARNRLQSLTELQVVKDGKRIALGSVADVRHESSVEVIKRKDRRRTVSVWADFKPDVETKTEISDQIKADIEAMDIPDGYKISAGEGNEVRQEATVFLQQAFMMALLLIFIVMVLQFNSVSQPFIILISVFLSIGGVFWGLVLSQKVFVIIMSGIGSISLAGVVVNNAIVLIDFINQLHKEGKSPFEAVLEGGKTRLRPVLLTAVTTVIGLLPMALGWSIDFRAMTIQFESESSGWWGHMAWAVIFGLSFATIFTLFVVPALTYIDLTKRERGAKLLSLIRRIKVKVLPST